MAETEDAAMRGVLPVIGANWWAFALRGVFALILAAFAVSWPGLTGRLLAVLFASYLLVDAIFAFITAVVGAEDQRRWWPLLAESTLGVVVSFAIFLIPDAGVETLVYLLAVWAALTGILQIYAGVLLRRRIEGDEWWLTTAGVASLAFAAALVVLPGPGLGLLVLLLAAYATFFGVALIALAYQVRSVQRGSLAELSARAG